MEHDFLYFENFWNCLKSAKVHTKLPRNKCKPDTKKLHKFDFKKCKQIMSQFLSVQQAILYGHFTMYVRSALERHIRSSYQLFNSYKICQKFWYQVFNLILSDLVWSLEILAWDISGYLKGKLNQVNMKY